MRVTEIFRSIDGEVSLVGQGCLSTFIRLAGCNLKCGYCDTPASRAPGYERDVPHLMKAIEVEGCPKITITGGEPLLQGKEVFPLIDSLLIHGYIVTVETNGTLPIPYLYMRKPNLGWIVDYKLDAEDKMEPGAFKELANHNWVKILIRDRQDYEKAVEVMGKLQSDPLNCRAKIALSPMFDDEMRPIMDPKTLVRWLLEDQLFHVSLNVQIHKLIGVQ